MIPHTIHRIWVGGSEPDWTRPYASTWEQPGWELRRWDDSNVESLFPLDNQHIYDAAEQIAPNHVGQLRSDVLRYEILLRFGGVYVDADFRCLKPIDELIEGATCFAAWEIQDTWLANGFMGSVPDNLFIRTLVQGLPTNVSKYRGNKPNKLTGPQYLTRMHRRFDGLDLTLPQSLIYPYGWEEINEHKPNEDWPDAYMCHEWSNKRREAGQLCLT